MADQYDVIVLGSGPGGYVAAIRAEDDHIILVSHWYFPLPR